MNNKHLSNIINNQKGGSNNEDSKLNLLTDMLSDNNDAENYTKSLLDLLISEQSDFHTNSPKNENNLKNLANLTSTNMMYGGEINLLSNGEIESINKIISNLEKYKNCQRSDYIDNIKSTLSNLDINLNTFDMHNQQMINNEVKKINKYALKLQIHSKRLKKLL